MPIRPTCILPGSSFFFSPVTAIVAKYWMTRFVFTVFPAPDSPLSNKNQRRDQNYSSHCQHLRQSPPIREEGKITYVIRMDWFSLSVGRRCGGQVRSSSGCFVISPPCPSSLHLSQRPEPLGRRGPQEALHLGPVTCQHVLVGVVGDGEDVGRCLTPLLAPVGGHHLGVVHWQPLVGVDGDAEEARVGLGEEKK